MPDHGPRSTLTGPPSEDRSPRVRMELSRDGAMDVNLSPDASPETIAALRALGEAALDLLAEEA